MNHLLRTKLQYRVAPAVVIALGTTAHFATQQQQQQESSYATTKTQCSFFVPQTSPSHRQPPPPLRRLSTIEAFQHTANTQETIDHKYKVQWKNPIGKGMFGDVYRAVSLLKSQDEPVAVKKISKRFTNDASFQREMDNLLFLEKTGGHPSICLLREHFETKDHFYLVLDLIQGGELFEHLCRYGAYSEADAARLMRQTASALAFLHGVGVVHSDLKPENLMLSSPNEDEANIKIVDFGCAHRIDQESSHDHHRGTGLTPGYAPPEAIVAKVEGKHCEMDPSFDMWSLGVIMYVILTGRHPFDWDGDATNDEMEDRIMNGEGPFLRNHEFTKDLSEEALEVLEKLMERDPKKRITAQELLAHPWIKGETATSTVLSGSDKRLAAYQRHSTKVGSSVFKSLLANSDKHGGSQSAKRTNILEMAFRDLDPKNRGYISTKELNGITSFLAADAKLSLRELQHLLKDDMTPHNFEKNKVIYKEGSKGSSMYFLQSGSVEVTSKSGFKAVRQSGSFFGEDALMSEDGVHTGTVTCLTPVQVLEVSREYFEKYLKADEEVEMTMVEMSAQRLRERAKVLFGLSNKLATAEYKPGEVLFNEGSDGNDLFILEKGNVDIFASSRKVRSLRTGEMTGEHAAFYERKPYNVTAKCMGPEPCTMQILNGKHIRRMCKKSKDLHDSFRDIILRRDFKKALVHMTQRDFPESESELRRAFNIIDGDASGEITLDKIREAIIRWDKEYTEEDIQDMLKSLDLKGQGKLTWPDFKRIFSMFNEM